MTKFFVLAAITLAASVAGCSADTTEEGSSTTTTNNGTLPDRPAVSESDVVRKPVSKNDPAAAKSLASVGDRGEGIRGLRQTVSTSSAPAPGAEARPDARADQPVARAGAPHTGRLRRPRGGVWGEAPW